MKFLKTLYTFICYCSLYTKQKLEKDGKKLRAESFWKNKDMENDLRNWIM